MIERVLPATVEAIRVRREDPNRVGHHDHDRPPLPGTGHGETGPATKRIIVGYGFWIFLLSDIVMFACFFATFAVLRNATGGGPTIQQIVDLPRVGWETACLLLSSFTCGISFAAANARNRLWAQILLIVTGCLGLAFVLMELDEFIGLARAGVMPQRSGFLTAFFSLVGLHGLHVTVGLLWLGTMLAQVQVKGFRHEIMRRLICFNLFWHALDIVWVGIFTIVYLMGAIA
jgi:cytochrome o ubiquinol oxidase subunit 3